MKNTIIRGLLFFVLSSCMESINASSNVVFVGRIIVSNTAERITYDVIDPGKSVETITNNDTVIFYDADIGVINPTKKKYGIKILCTDKNGKNIFKGSVNRSLSMGDNVDGDIIGRIVQQLELDPKSGAMVEGQLAPLESGNDYLLNCILICN